MIYRIILKFGDRYITRFENGTWDEIKTYYGKKAIKIIPKGGQLENCNH